MIAIPGPPGAPVQWMVAPPSIPGVPRGLEYLTQVDQLLVHQQIELLESEYASVPAYMYLLSWIYTVLKHKNVLKHFKNLERSTRLKVRLKVF